MNGNAVREELVRLGDELLADATLSDKVKAFLHLWKYASLATVADAAAAAQVIKKRAAEHFEVHHVNVGPTQNFPKTGRAMSPERQQILGAAREIVEVFGEGGSPVRTAAIYEALTDELRSRIVGIDPKSSLSAMLSNSPWFESHGRRGWTLRGTQADEPAEEVVYEVLAPGRIVEVSPEAA